MIKRQKDFAAALETTESNVSKMLRGDEKALTDSICKRLVAAYPMFSLSWVLTGDGNMLTAKPNFLIEYRQGDKSDWRDDKINLLEQMNGLKDEKITYLESVIKRLNGEIEALKKSKRDGRDWGGFGVSTADERAKK